MYTTNTRGIKLKNIPIYIQTFARTVGTLYAVESRLTGWAAAGKQTSRYLVVVDVLLSLLLVAYTD